MNVFDNLTKNPNLGKINVPNGTTTPQGEHLCKIILNLFINVEVMAQTRSIYNHFII